jgi:hypothetical protein
MWLFPLAFLGSTLTPLFARHPSGVFWFIDAPLFVLCYYMASRPVRQRHVTARQGFAFIVLVPFVIGMVLILGAFAGALLL